MCVCIHTHTHTYIVVVQLPSCIQLLWPHGLQHARLLYPSPSPGDCPSSFSLYWRCPPAISSSDTLFSFCPQSVPASGTFPMSQPLASGEQNTGASASASVLPMNIQGWFPLGLTSLISLLSKGLSGVFSCSQFRVINSLVLYLFYSPALTTVCDYWENHILDHMDLCPYRVWQSDGSAFQHTD